MKCKPGPRAALILAAVFVLAGSLVAADPHPGQSVNVVIIGGSTLTGASCSSGPPSAANYMGATAGGCLPVTGPIGELGDFLFTPMAPGTVSAQTLAPFDTAVLNMATSQMACNANSLNAQAQADIVAFVAAGKKLIIYDSECTPGPDYDWIPYPFSTSNPGAQGAQGTLTVVENNLLSTMVGDPLCSGEDPHCINVDHLGTQTDAVGDMNVMTTYDPNWCLDMSGTNVIGVTGPVHTYANYPAGTDVGLIIYNGLDQDFQWNNDAQLKKMWLQELQQPFNPSNLPCRVPIVGVKLAPETAQNEAGTAHTVTATLTDLLNNPQPGIQVTFEVTGPNAGAVGTCTVNAGCTTDANGQVSFTYTGLIVGTDTIVGCFLNQAQVEVCSQPVSKEWIITNKPPDCLTAVPSVSLLWPPNHQYVSVGILGVTDPDGDPVTVTITGIRQDEAVNAKGSGNTAPDAVIASPLAQVRAERVGDPKTPGNGRVYHIQFTAADGAGGTCSGEVRVGCPHDQGKGGPVDDGPIYDSTVVPTP